MEVRRVHDDDTQKIKWIRIVISFLHGKLQLFPE